MKQIDRIEFILKNLREKSYSIHELKELIENNNSISLRQIQRDLLKLHKFLTHEEKLIVYRKEYVKYYKIETNSDHATHNSIDDYIIKTNFYKQELSPQNIEKLELVKTAIDENKSILISHLIYDETGDNYTFVSTNIIFQPLKLIYHRSSIYVGGYNRKLDKIQIFGINQLDKISIHKYYKNQSDLNILLQNELLIRFGVSKNIDQNVYDIKIEISSVLAGFIRNHIWHPTQKFTKRNGNTIIHLRCGINRELIGWLFQWMYNIRVIEPDILKVYYDKTIHEIQKNNTSKFPLVYRNIFVDYK